MSRLAASLCCLVVLLATAPFTASQEVATPRRYSIKQEHPDIGSHILRDSISGSRVPVDKPFSELSEEDKAFWKSQYEGLGPTDVPPFPARGLKNLYKAMSVVQRKHLVRGNVTMFVQIDKAGRATSVSVITSPDPLLTEDIATILMLEEYTAALCAGVPCAMDFPFRASFTLR